MAQRQLKKQKEDITEWKKGQKCEIYDHAKKQWKIGVKCEIYDQLKKQWVQGEIVAVLKDDDPHWVDVKYGRKRKQLHPDSPIIRGLQKKKKLESVQGWKVGNQCEVYNREMRQWIDGEIIHIFTNQMGDWLRVQSGERIHDVLSDDIKRDLKLRGSSIMEMSVEDIQTMKNIATKHRSIAPILNRIFAKSDLFVSTKTITSYVIGVKCSHSVEFT